MKSYVDYDVIYDLLMKRHLDLGIEMDDTQKAYENKQLTIESYSDKMMKLIGRGSEIIHTLETLAKHRYFTDKSL